MPTPCESSSHRCSRDAAPVIRLIASDVDGTIVDHDGQLPPGRSEAVAAVRAAGIPIIFATGRLWSSVRELSDRLGLEGPHVTCNGSAVVGTDGTFHALELVDSDLADTLAAELHRRRIPYAVYLEDGSLVTDAVVSAHDVLPRLSEPMPTVGERDGRRAIKVLALISSDGEQDLRSIGADVARIQRTGPRFLEWSSARADKSTGVVHAARTLGVGLEATVAIGDAENDVPMLRGAALGVAVEGASGPAVSAADVHLGENLDAFLYMIAKGEIALPTATVSRTETA